MEIKTFCDNYFLDEVLNIEKLDLGLTNINYLITTNKDKYIVRIPGKNTSEFINREQEGIIQRALDNINLGIKAEFFDNISGIKVSKYLPNLVELKNNISARSLSQIAEKLKVLHNSQLKVNQNFNAINKFHLFKNGHESHPSETQIINNYLKLEYEPILCHNDLVSGNLLFNNDELLIIDYEYAGNNHPYFDIISLFSENNIFDENLRNAFYSSYFDKTISLAQRHELWVIECFQDLLWYYWALMMYKDYPEEIYQLIADDKLYNLDEVLKKEPVLID